MYGLHSRFDIELHKKAFPHYLEVIIDADGVVMYAVPSHQEKLIAVACDRLGVTRGELNALCPGEYYGDFMRWLCLLTGAMSVWNNWCEYGNPTVKQIGTLRRLKMEGLYQGPIPSYLDCDASPSLKDLIRDPKKAPVDLLMFEDALRAALSGPCVVEKRDEP